MQATRLLPFLTLIETALVENGSTSVSKPCSRTVNFHKGLARLSFEDGSGYIALQSFALADGQICLKAVMYWRSRNLVGAEAIYPQGDFNWADAADRVAQAWIAGPTEQQIQAAQSAGPVESLQQPLAATG